MRAREFIPEGRHVKPLRKSVKNSMSNLISYHALDNNNNPYLAYRFGMALAGSPDVDMDKKAQLASNFTISDYTDGDTEIRKGAERIMGVHPSTNTGKGSVELDVINKTSPVATPKKNKYGV